MQTSVLGTILLGFTSPEHCTLCGNVAVFRVYQDYHYQKIIGYTVTRQYFGVKKICPICEKGTWLIARNFFVSDKETQSVIRALDGGKDLMKNQMMNFSDEEKTLVLQRLNKLKAYDVVKYLSGDEL
jgi:hypothetical protein